MRTERNQLASVGRLHIWSLSDALPEKEVFQSVRIHRDGIVKPILAEETPSFHSTTVRSSTRFCVSRLCVSQKPFIKVQITAHGDGDHMAFRNLGSRIMYKIAFSEFGPDRRCYLPA
jgi:hypothetical protein